MSSSDNNITFKKTSFLSGINSEFINQFYSDYLSDPKSLPLSWRQFFEGLSDDLDGTRKIIARIVERAKGGEF